MNELHSKQSQPSYLAKVETDVHIKTISMSSLWTWNEVLGFIFGRSINI